MSKPTKAAKRAEKQRKLAERRARKMERKQQCPPTVTETLPPPAVLSDDALPAMANDYLFHPEKLNALCEWREEVRPLGLTNSGVTCYMNSALQALLSVPMMAQHLQQGTHSAVCSTEGWCAYCYLETLARAVVTTPKQAKSRSARPVQPKELIRNLESVNKFFSPFDQQDSHEFLLCLLDKLNEAFLKAAGLQAKELSDAKVHTTPVDQMFGGWGRQAIECPSCGYQSTTRTFFLDLSVPVDGHRRLEDGLATITAKEQLSGWTCDGCKATVDPHRRFTVDVAPQHLIVTLQVFDPINECKYRRQTTFPEALDLGPFTTQRTKTMYDLQAVVRHAGHSQHHGHYYAQTRVGAGWVEMDDECGTDVKLKDVVAHRSRDTDSAYILMYKRREFRVEPTDAPESTVACWQGPPTDATQPDGRGLVWMMKGEQRVKRLDPPRPRVWVR